MVIGNSITVQSSQESTANESGSHLRPCINTCHGDLIVAIWSLISHEILIQRHIYIEIESLFWQIASSRVQLWSTRTTITTNGGKIILDQALRVLLGSSRANRTLNMVQTFHYFCVIHRLVSKLTSLINGNLLTMMRIERAAFRSNQYSDHVCVNMCCFRLFLPVNKYLRGPIHSLPEKWKGRLSFFNNSFSSNCDKFEVWTIKVYDYYLVTPLKLRVDK